VLVSFQASVDVLAGRVRRASQGMQHMVRIAAGSNLKETAARASLAFGHAAVIPHIPLCGSGLATKKKLMTTLPRCEQFGSGFASSGNDRLVSCERVSRLSDLESAVQAENQSKRIRPRTKTAHDFANIRIRIPRTPVFL
jgi:hypothetical protein